MENNQIENQIDNSVEVNVTPEVVTEVNMTPEFLMVPTLKGIKLEGVVKNTYDVIKALKKHDAPQRIFLINYEKEVKRLKDNESSLVCKRTAKAKELNMPLDEYIEKHCNNRASSGGAKKTTYSYEINDVEIEFNEYELKAIPFLKELKLLPTKFDNIDDQLYWLSLDSESTRYRNNVSSLKSKSKKD
jgi:hypothetical protein